MFLDTAIQKADYIMRVEIQIFGGETLGTFTPQLITGTLEDIKRVLKQLNYTATALYSSSTTGDNMPLACKNPRHIQVGMYLSLWQMSFIMIQGYSTAV